VAWPRAEVESLGLTLSPYSVNFIVLAIACWQAFEARDIECEFAEAKYIALAVFSMSQGFLTGIPIVAIAKDIPEAFYLILTFLLFVVCMVVLMLIFLPKIFMHRRYDRLSIKEQRKAMAVSVRLSSGQSTSIISGLQSSAIRKGSNAFEPNDNNRERGYRINNNNVNTPETINLPRVNEIEAPSDSANASDPNSKNSSSNSNATVSDSNHAADEVVAKTNLATNDNAAPTSGAFVEKEGHGRRLYSSYIDDEVVHS
jgi:hypothetical protein